MKSTYIGFTTEVQAKVPVRRDRWVDVVSENLSVLRQLAWTPDAASYITCSQYICISTWIGTLECIDRFAMVHKYGVFQEICTWSVLGFSRGFLSVHLFISSGMTSLTSDQEITSTQYSWIKPKEYGNKISWVQWELTIPNTNQKHIKPDVKYNWKRCACIISCLGIRDQLEIYVNKQCMIQYTTLNICNL